VEYLFIAKINVHLTTAYHASTLLFRDYVVGVFMILFRNKI